MDLYEDFHAKGVSLEASEAMKEKVSGIMKQLVAGFLIAYHTASSRIMRMTAT